MNVQALPRLIEDGLRAAAGWFRASALVKLIWPKLSAREGRGGTVAGQQRAEAYCTYQPPVSSHLALLNDDGRRLCRRCAADDGHLGGGAAAAVVVVVHVLL